jgi:hypothetical protein
MAGPGTSIHSLGLGMWVVGEVLTTIRTCVLLAGVLRPAGARRSPGVEDRAVTADGTAYVSDARRAIGR